MFICKENPFILLASITLLNAGGGKQYVVIMSFNLQTWPEKHVNQLETFLEFTRFYV